MKCETLNVSEHCFIRFFSFLIFTTDYFTNLISKFLLSSVYWCTTGQSIRMVFQLFSVIWPLTHHIPMSFSQWKSFGSLRAVVLYSWYSRFIVFINFPLLLTVAPINVYPQVSVFFSCLGYSSMAEESFPVLMFVVDCTEEMVGSSSELVIFEK